MKKSSVTKLDPKVLVHIHDLMVKARALEERMIRMYKQNEGYFWLGGPGEEAFNVPLGLLADKARRGDGPSFIELLTYRVSAHSSSDDPSRYRDEKLTDVWRHQKDPLRRAELYLRRAGWLAEGEREALAAQIEADVRDSIARQEATPLPARESLIEDVYEEPPWHLREQLADVVAAPRAKNPHHH